ncbi:amidohydrolase family protein [Anaeromyxobacter sp. SG17]|uniref:amidohydrolase family protein n=1 Tax=Anaeromyxobacter sp. SG17 TaxID=2925405 RepID=UPI001F58A74B|nr:amidohydrolase family protein [Anaeromyxobacter sp. SG17]
MRFARARRRLLLLALLALAACRSARPSAGAGAKVTESAAPGRDHALVVRGHVILPDGTAIDDGVVVIEGNRIVRVGSASDVAAPPHAEVVGGPDRWVIPGLIDAHVHFFQSGSIYTRPDGVDLTARVPYAQERAAIRAKIDDVFRRYLRSGVTAVVDMGGPEWNFEVRERAARSPLAPRVAVAGPLLSSVARPQLALDDPPMVQVTDPDGARRAVRAQLRRQPDLVKLWWLVPKGATPETWRAVAQAAIDEAHAAGARVAVHATELETARLALLAGADVLVHGVRDAPLDDAILALARDRRVPWVTTAVVGEGYYEFLTRAPRLSRAEVEIADPFIVATLLDPVELPPDLVARARERGPFGPYQLENIRRERDAGVLVVAGSDAGNPGTFHGPAIHRELELLVQAGLTPAEALAACTGSASRVVSRFADLGAIEPGKLADLVVLEASPLADIRNTSRIALVVKDGRALRPDEILPRTAVEVVQMQLDAYNAQDLEAFLATYADDAAVESAAEGRTLSAGKASLRERYRDLFAKHPQNRARVVERKTEADRIVLDHEIITGRAPDKPDPWDVGWVRYEVEGGLIRKVMLP